MRIFTLVLSIVLFHNISFAKWTIIDSTQLGKLNSDIRNLYVDNNDNCWFITILGGIYKFDGTTTICYDTSNTPLPFTEISCLTQGPNGDMYFGTYEDDTFEPSEKQTCLIRYNGEEWEYFNQFNSPMYPYGIQDILVTGEDEFWSANVIGLYHYKKGKWNSYFEDENLYRRDINKLAIDKNNKLYITNSSKELYSADLNKTNIKFNKIETPFTQQGGVLLCNVDSLNNLWVRYNNLYLYKKDGNNWIIYDSTSFDFINIYGGIYISKNKKTYCNTNKAVYEYKENSYWERAFDIPDSIYNGFVRLKGIDSKGNFWFHSQYENKLFKYTPEQNSVKQKSNVSIYPNPTQSTITINTENPIINLALYSMNLSKISEYPANHTTTQEVDISIIPSGIYFIKVNDDLIKFVRE